MTFSNIRSLASYIIDHHMSFGGEGGFGFLSDTKDALLGAKESFLSCKALVSIQYEAWTSPCYGELHTVVSLSRSADGVWEYTECSYDAAVRMGII